MNIATDGSSYETLLNEIGWQPLRREKGGTELVGACPSPACGDPDHFYVNSTSGLCFCQKCGAKGNARTFLKLMGVRGREISDLLLKHGLDTGQTTQITKKQSDKPYRPRKGLVPASAEATQRFGSVKSLDPATVERVGPSMTPDEKTLFFPGYDASGKLCTHIRAAVDGGLVKTEKSGSKKYPVAAGGKSGLLGYYECVDNPTVYIFEGLKDTIKALEIGLPATSPTNGCKQHFNGIAEFFRGKNVFICYDCDVPGVDGAKSRATELCNVAASVRIIKLPFQITPDHGKDFWDFMLDHTKEDFLRLVEEAEPFEPAKEAEPKTRKLLSFTRGDFGNGEAFAAACGDNFRFDKKIGKYRVDTGKVWAEDEGQSRKFFVEKVARAMRKEALELSGEERAAAEKYARTLENSNKITNALKEAQVHLIRSVWDEDPMLFNCQNGPIDLRTGQIRPHRKDDYLTKISQVVFDRAARSPIFDRFLDDATGGNKEYQRFLQKAAGYSLTGRTDEEKMFFVHGPAASCKSSFAEGLKGISGDYGRTADFAMFLQRSIGGIRCDIAALDGVRFLSSLEINDGERVAESVFKSIISADTQNARNLYSAPFEFIPECKLWLFANHKPRVDDQDTAIWRRILVLPFEHTIPPAKRDPAIKAFLKDPKRGGPVLLAWAVEGCRLWQAEGLGDVPNVIQAATDDYKAEMDPLGDFKEMLDTHPEAKISVSELRAAYDKFCRESGQRFPLLPNRFNQRIEALGGVRCDKWWNGRSRNVWVGVGLKSGFLDE